MTAPLLVPSRPSRLVALLGPQRWWVLLTALLATATLAAGVGLIAMAAYLISRSAEVDSTATLALTITGVRFFAVARATSRYLERYVGHLATFRALTRIRTWFFRAIEPIAPAGLQSRRWGDLLTRILGDIDTLQDVTLRVAVPALAAAATALLTGAVLGSLSVGLGVAAVVALVLVGIVLPAALRWIGRSAADAVASAKGQLEADAVESIAGLAELVAWGREDRLTDAVDRGTDSVAGLDRRLARLRGAATGIGALLVGLAAMVLLALAVPLVRSGALDPNLLAVVPLVMLAAFESVQPLAAAMEHLGRGRAAAARLDDLVDAAPAVIEPSHPVAPPVAGGSSPGLALEVEDLDFAYDPGAAPALAGVSMRVPAGAHAVVVGPSGSGKSTLVSLLLRFWDYRSGSIRLGGTELRCLRADDARRLVAVVAQHDHLFDTSVRDNLLLADPDADDERLLGALDAASARTFVEARPGGLDARVGEGGTALSGGERQRLMIARALLADAPLLVLDEATAHLDAATESEVLAGVRRWQHGRTLVVISHREAATECADLIIRLGGADDLAGR